MSLAVTYRRPGDPAEVLEVTNIGDPPPPAPGQIQVRVSAFPIHPGDFLYISAPRSLDGEQTAGIQTWGAGTDVGDGVTGFSPGARVSFFPHPGAWREVVNVDAATAVPVPDSVPDEAAAQMLCNPITVLMLRRRAAQQHFSVGFDGGGARTTRTSKGVAIWFSHPHTWMAASRRCAWWSGWTRPRLPCRIWC